ncbi:MAG: TCR/Tet family MFS transporter, partial [Nitrosomonadaceae bacterium]|nr:TCR/Tet family MFS transporter [Nitrosomonadaceae bacterium]
MAAEASTDAKSEAAKQRGFRFVLAVVFLDMLGVGLAVPVLPLLVGDFVSQPDAQARWYGVLAMTFGLMQFLCMPLLGAFSDKIGRKPVLIFSSAGMGLNFLVTAWAPSLAWLFVGRFIGGACAASMSTASAYASDISTPANRAKTFGLIGAAFGVGFIAGPMLGGVLGSVDYQLPFYVGAGLCFANAIFGYFFVEESLPKNKRSAFSFAKSNPFSSFRRLFARADIGALIIVFALASFAQILQQTTWVLYTHFKFGWGPKENGIALFLVGLTAAVVQAAMLPRLIRAMGEVKLSLIGMAVAVVAYFANGLASAGWVIYVLVVANFLSYAAGPALQAIVSKATDPREQGALMGSLQSLSSVSIVIAPIVSTVILAEVSHYPMSDWRLGAVFYLAAFLQLIGVLLAWRFFAQRGIPVHPANQSPPTPSS